MLLRSPAAVLILGVAIPALAQEECTTAIVSGSAFGHRPLIWKNRDSSHRDNAVVVLRGERFGYLALINAGDTTQAWAGVNEAGFGIMNAEALDTEGDSLDAEGYFMAFALGTCATVDDFEDLLRQTNERGRGTKSNFGVLDARGTVAYFEAGNHTYARYDPPPEQGWLVRTNFAQTGDGNGAGYFRFTRARELFRELAEQGELSVLHVLGRVARDLVTPSTRVEGVQDSRWRCTQNAINRYRTVACAIVEGVRPVEDPRLTTFWVILGEPAFGAALPLWASVGEVPEAVRGPAKPPINDLIQRLEQRAYRDPQRPCLLDIGWFRRPVGRSLQSRLRQFEMRWYARVNSVRRIQAHSGLDVSQLAELQEMAAAELENLLIGEGGTQ